jgi:hypothetical protein
MVIRGIALAPLHLMAETVTVFESSYLKDSGIMSNAQNGNYIY